MCQVGNSDKCFLGGENLASILEDVAGESSQANHERSNSEKEEYDGLVVGGGFHHLDLIVPELFSSFLNFAPPFYTLKEKVMYRGSCLITCMC